MNKREAKWQAMGNARSIGELRELIASNRGRSGMSKINPSLSVTQILDILDAAIASRDAEEIPKGIGINFYTERAEITKDGLIIMNILQECG